MHKNNWLKITNLDGTFMLACGKHTQTSMYSIKIIPGVFSTLATECTVYNYSINIHYKFDRSFVECCFFLTLNNKVISKWLHPM